MKKIVLSTILIFVIGNVFAQKKTFWKKLEINEVLKLERKRPNFTTEGEQYFTLDFASLKQVLFAGLNSNATNGFEIEIPNMDGELEKFLIIENSNLEPSFQAQYPQIRSFKGRGITNKGATINISTGIKGIQTLVFRPDNGVEFIEAYDKAATAYVVFNSMNRNKGKLPFNCSTVDEKMTEEIYESTNLTYRSSNSVSKTMRLALSCTAEYSNYFSAYSAADVQLVIDAMNATMTRVNGVMEKDIAVHLNMVDNTSVIYYDPATDPYDAGTTGAGGTWNNQLKTVLTTFGSALFDIGHMFGQSGGGGNAGCIGCVCVSTNGTSYKGRGFTSPSDGVPEGDNFDIDYVVHEMGHQLGGNHSFTYSSEGTVAQVEPGSGNTIMGYAGITSYDVQTHSDAMYAYVNIKQIQANLALASKTCPVSTPMTANATPVVNAGTDYTIPKGTAFVLTGTASDADATDVMTYNWEQNDVGGTTNVNASSEVKSTKASGPIFKSFPSASTPVRFFPQMSKVLTGTIAVTTASLTNWETVSTVARTINFTFTARDNHIGTDYGQTATDAMIVTVDATKGPLTITSQATTGISYNANSTQTITWAVNSTNTIPGGDLVDIYLCTNAGSGNNATFSTLLASGVPNSGTADVIIPPVTTSFARFMVKSTNNIFFAINSKNFAISNLANEDFSLANFSLYPNPNKGSFDIQFESNSSNLIDITVHDLRGRSIFNQTFDNTGLINQNISLNNVQSGIYLVTVKDGERKVSKKIIIE